MEFTYEQLASEQSVELRLKDKSKYDKVTPVTSDETLYEISSIKENKKIEQHKKDFIDRFGNLTSEITNLYELSKLKNI